MSTVTCIGCGAFVAYSATSPNNTKAAKVMQMSIGAGLVALGTFNWYARGDEESLRRVNEVLDRVEAFIKRT